MEKMLKDNSKGGRTVKLTKAPNEPLGVGLAPSKDGFYFNIEFVKEASVAKGVIFRGERIWRINGKHVDCLTEKECRSTIKRIDAAASLSLLVRPKPPPRKKASGGGSGCCGKKGRGGDDLFADDGDNDADGGFKGADDDGDGLLSKRELVDQLLDAGATAEEAEQLFSVLDADGDGIVSMEEYSRMDADGDGVVSREELLNAVDLSWAQASGGEPPPPLEVGQILHWLNENGEKIVLIAIPEPPEGPHMLPPDSDDDEDEWAAWEAASTQYEPSGRLVWTAAPTVSPTGHATHEKWRLAGESA